MLRTVRAPSETLRKLLQNLPPTASKLSPLSGIFSFVSRAVGPISVKQVVSLLLASMLAASAAAQPPPRPPVVGPNGETPRRDLWQILKPEQREQLWRLLTPEQRADLWRSLEPRERREMRDRLPPGEPGAEGPWAARRLDPGDPTSRMTMTPEERQQMREQIREAHRLRRERLEAERARRPE